jgi:Na+/glutamate symporter
MGMDWSATLEAAANFGEVVSAASVAVVTVQSLKKTSRHKLQQAIVAMARSGSPHL